MVARVHLWRVCGQPAVSAGRDSRCMTSTTQTNPAPHKWATLALCAVGSLVLHFLLREPAPAQVVLFEELPGTIALNLLLTLPVVYPAVIALGYDPIWFGIVVVKMCEICLITPPIGLNCFVVNGVRPDIPLSDVFRGIMPFFLADVVTLALFLAFPDIILWLPRTMHMS